MSHTEAASSANDRYNTMFKELYGWKDVLVNAISSSGSMHENLLLNGDFDIWQRGTAFTGGYTADRWKISSNASACSVSCVNQNDMYGKYSVYMTLAAKGSMTDFALGQVLETADCIKLRGRRVTFSAVLNRNAAFNSGTFRMDVYTGTGVDEPWVSTGRVITGIDIPAAGIGLADYSTHSVTAAVPNDAKQIAVLLRFRADCPDGSVVCIRHCQLSVSDTPAECRKRSFGEELALCQRYFEKSYNTDTAPGSANSTGAHVANICLDSGGNSWTSVRYHASKRVQPAVHLYMNNGTDGAWAYSRNGLEITSTPTVGHAGVNGFSCYVHDTVTWVPCQIWGHWTADAEL